MKIKMSFWSIVFYLSLLVLTIWLILKVTGYINTPLWLEYGVPISSFIFTVLSLYRDLIKNINKLGINLATLSINSEHINLKVNDINLKLNNMDVKLNNVYNDVEFLKRK